MNSYRQCLLTRKQDKETLFLTCWLPIGASKKGDEVLLRDYKGKSGSSKPWTIEIVYAERTDAPNYHQSIYISSGLLR